VSRLEEALAVIGQCLSGSGNITFAGEYFDLDHAPFGLLPPEGRRPEIWVAAHGPRTLGLAGRYADGWLPTVLGEPASYSAQLERVRNVASESGRHPDAVTPGLQVFVAGGESSAEVASVLASPPAKLLGILQPAGEWERLGYAHPLGGDFRGHADWRPHRVDRAGLGLLLAEVPPEVVAGALLHGTPDELVNQVHAYVEVGLQHIVLQPVPGLPPPPPTSPSSLLSIAQVLTT